MKTVMRGEDFPPVQEATVSIAAARGTLLTDYCIVGFPKCGTTAVATFFEACPCCNLAKQNGSYESPYFTRHDSDPTPDYVQDRVNGHKYSLYAYSTTAMQRVFAANQNVLFIFCIRSARAALLSWWRMHRIIAERGEPEAHPVNQTKESRYFFRTCTPEKYYAEFAERRLHYAREIKRFRKRLPEARFVIVSQARLARDARNVMTAIYALLGVEIPTNYLRSLPEMHQSFGDAVGKEIPLLPEVVGALEEMDRRLVEVIDELADEQNLTLRKVDGSGTF